MLLEEKLQKYEEVRLSGVTNMFDVKTVMKLSGLDREDILDIMKNYDSYMKKYKI
jgi:hypothetical protein